jgi:hypothetical protein
VDGEVLRLVRIRCRYPVTDGIIIARDVDPSGRVHFVLLQPRDGGRVVKYAVDPATEKPVGPPLDEP